MTGIISSRGEMFYVSVCPRGPKSLDTGLSLKGQNVLEMSECISPGAK